MGRIKEYYADSEDWKDFTDWQPEDPNCYYNDRQARYFGKGKPKKAPKGKEWAWKEPGGLLGHSTSEARAYWSPETYGLRGWWELVTKT